MMIVNFFLEHSIILPPKIMEEIWVEFKFKLFKLLNFNLFVIYYYVCPSATWTYE